MHRKTSAQSLLSTCVLTLYYHHDNSGRNVPCDLFFLPLFALVSGFLLNILNGMEQPNQPSCLYNPGLWNRGGQTGTLKGKEGKQEVLPSFSILSPLINHSLDFYSISPVHPHSSLKLFQRTSNELRSSHRKLPEHKRPHQIQTHSNGRSTEDYEYRSKENPKAKTVSHDTLLCEMVSRAPLGRQSRSE